MNSRMAWSYERLELVDVRLFKTADFDCSRSGNLRTVFGTRLRLLFAIGSGLQRRGEKRDPVPDLLTRSAFLFTYLVSLPTTGLLDSRTSHVAGLFIKRSYSARSMQLKSPYSLSNERFSCCQS